MKTVDSDKKTRSKSLITVALICVAVIAVLGIFINKKIYNAKIELGYKNEINSSNNYAIDTTIIELIANPDKYDCNLVRVIGVGNMEFEGNAIYLSKENYTYSTMNCVWIELSNRSLSEQEAKNLMENML